MPLRDKESDFVGAVVPEPEAEVSALVCVAEGEAERLPPVVRVQLGAAVGVLGAGVGGTSVVGTEVVGTAVAGTRVEGAAVVGTAVVGTEVDGTAVVGTRVEGTIVEGWLVEGTLVDGAAVGHSEGYHAQLGMVPVPQVDDRQLFDI